MLVLFFYLVWLSILAGQELVKCVHEQLALIILWLLNKVLCEAGVLHLGYAFLASLTFAIDYVINRRFKPWVVILNVDVQHKKCWILYFATLQLVSVLLARREANYLVFLADRKVVDFYLKTWQQFLILGKLYTLFWHINRLHFPVHGLSLLQSLFLRLDFFDECAQNGLHLLVFG